MIDDPNTGGSESGAWQRALDRGCLQGRASEHMPDPWSDAFIAEYWPGADPNDIRRQRRALSSEAR